jgi:hypothetical protein
MNGVCTAHPIILGMNSYLLNGMPEVYEATHEILSVVVILPHFSVPICFHHFVLRYLRRASIRAEVWRPYRFSERLHCEEAAGVMRESVIEC